MSISGIGTSGATSVTDALLLQRKRVAAGDSGATPAVGTTQDSFTSDFASILAAVKAGDIGSAQTALTKLTSDIPATDAGYSPSSTAPASATQTDLQSLIQAVQGGDITGAQKALASLQADVQSAEVSGGGMPKGHHHHHHHAAAAAATAAPTDPLSPTSSDSTPDQATSQVSAS